VIDNQQTTVVGHMTTDESRPLTVVIVGGAGSMGPFSLSARPILEAAIECGCDYMDIDDDWESTLAAFELDARAR
jgi:short subunit dehydrogenase-like uncharacterized protein